MNGGFRLVSVPACENGIIGAKGRTGAKRQIMLALLVLAAVGLSLVFERLAQH
jgi:hypothetical protein